MNKLYVLSVLFSLIIISGCSWFTAEEELMNQVSEQVEDTLDIQEEEVEEEERKDESMVEYTDTGSLKVPIRVGDAEEEVLLEYNKYFANLINSYSKAQFETMAVLNIDPDNTTLEEYEELLETNIETWAEVEEIAKEFHEFAKGQEETAFHFISQAYAQDDRMVPVQDLEEKYNVHDEKPPLTDWEQIEITTREKPHLDKIAIIADHFGVTAREAKNIMEDHYQDRAAYWTDRAKYWDKASKTATHIKNASKVGLFVTGAIVTAGGSTVLYMPVGTAFSTAMGAQIGTAASIEIVVQGSSALLQVQEDFCTVVLGNEEAAASFAEMNSYLAIPTTVYSLQSLAGDGLKDPENVLNITEWGLSLMEMEKKGAKQVSLDLRDKFAYVDNKLKYNPSFTPTELLLEKLPSKYNYDTELQNPLVELIQRQIELEKEIMEKEMQEWRQHLKGVYRGPVSVSLSQELGVIASSEVKILITEEGTANVTVDWSDTIQLGPGMGTQASLKLDIPGELYLDGRFEAEGPYESVSKINIPQVTLDNMPAEYKKYATGLNQVGTAMFDGNYENGVISGVVTLSSSSGDMQGTFNVEVK